MFRKKHARMVPILEDPSKGLDIFHILSRVENPHLHLSLGLSECQTYSPINDFAGQKELRKFDMNFEKK